MPIREDFRRDGLAATFLTSAALFRLIADALPPHSLVNIGYPSICEEEELRCKEILNLERNKIEFCLVGHARRTDLEIMSSLLKNRNQVSANIWLPASRVSANKLLHCTTETIFKRAIDCITYWKTISTAPLDIALTDCTADEHDLDARLVDWTARLKAYGYRRTIICDTKGIGERDRLIQLFSKLSDFEWHPHDDNGRGLSLAEFALDGGAHCIGTSLFQCSERHNMLDPRQIPGIDVNETLIAEFARGFDSQFGSLESLRDTVYNNDVILTGTHYRLWGKARGSRVLFGATSDSEIAQLILNEQFLPQEIKVLKNELLYRRKQPFLTPGEFLEQSSEFLPRLRRNRVSVLKSFSKEDQHAKASVL